MESYYKGFLLYHAILDHAMMVPDCIRIALIKIRWSHGHFIFIMEIPISGMMVFILKRGPNF